MGGKIFFSFIFILFVILSLVFYWFVPLGTSEFMMKSETEVSDYPVSNESKDIQFYPNMRYPDSKISYHIEDCTLQKKQDMERAFEIISDKTILNFYLVEDSEEISVTCDSKNKFEGGLFMAGEGGPISITKTGEFNVIFNGKILLIKESSCPNPNIALHELLHALGFSHSSNPDSIMYSVTNCKQTIGQEIIELINELYSIPSYPDLLFENVSAVMHGSYLDLNMSIRNNGFKDAYGIKVIIYADEKIVKDMDLDILGVGYGRLVILKNVWVKTRSVDKLELFINYNFNELEKENNQIILKIKNEK